MRLIDADELIEGRVENDPVRIAAECAPTAFDKEKVIEKLQRRSHNYYPSIDHYCLSRKAVDLKDAIEIVEKGGIE